MKSLLSTLLSTLLLLCLIAVCAAFKLWKINFMYHLIWG